MKHYKQKLQPQNAFEINDETGDVIKITGNTLPSEDVDVLKAMGIKNDSGVLFSALTPEEITDQLGIWEEQGYPTHINKLISKSDNLFNAKFNTLSSLDSENLVSNGYFSNGTAGWTKLASASDLSVINGELSYQGNGVIWAGAYTNVDVTANHLYYLSAKVRATGTILTPDGTNTIGLHLPKTVSIFLR